MRKRIRFALFVLFLVALTFSAQASDDKTDRATLAGVKAVCTIVEVTGPTQEGVPVDRNRLKVELDGRLGAASIATDPKASACLYLKAQLLPAMGRSKTPGSSKNSKPVGLYAFSISLEFYQAVTLGRAPTVKTYVPTWSVSNLATLPAEDLGPTARQMTVDLASRFVDAYQASNQK